MTSVVYNIARPRKIPFFTLDPFFVRRKAKNVFSLAKQAYWLSVPSVHNALWRQIGLSSSSELSQGTEGVWAK